MRRGSDVFVVIPMKLVPDRLIEIESYLTFFAQSHELNYDGWGAFE